MNEAAIKAISDNYLRDQNIRRQATEGSTLKPAANALGIAQKRHDSCRGVLGMLPTIDNSYRFECCDCHEVVEVSAIEASI